MQNPLKWLFVKTQESIKPTTTAVVTPQTVAKSPLKSPQKSPKKSPNRS